MKWSIRNIEMENFKFFKSRFSLDVDRKHVLLYGENGSGKSSIYWSVYTHFQAYTKDRADAQKYFLPHNPQNLRNRFTDEECKSSIKISFDNGEGETKEIEDSNLCYYPSSAETCRFMRGTAMSSDFLNYKLLSSLFDFRNSEDNQVFDIFEKEALPYIDLAEPYEKIDGTRTSVMNAGEWWQYINKVLKTDGAIPRNGRKYSSFNRTTQQYKAYQVCISSFNRLLEEKFQWLILRANVILKTVFQIDAEIVGEYHKAVFNKYVGPRRYSSQLERPKLCLKAKITSEKLKDDTVIEHPHSFFNEAKITCMSLSLRLAILEEHSATDEFSSVLLVDDLLISLDMPLRRVVIKQLLTYTARFQMFIFTHDRAFFHLVKSEIEQAGNTDDWKFYFLYSYRNEEGYLEPVLVTEKSYIEKALEHLTMFEIPAAVNALRKSAEKSLKDILALNEILEIIYHHRFCNLSNMIDIFRKKYANLLGLQALAAHLQDDRQILLNPFSHDDIDTPFYRKELDRTLEEIEILARIQKTIIVKYEDVRVIKYRMSVSKDSIAVDCEILFLEQFASFQYDGNIYYQNPKVFVFSSSHPKITVKEWGLNKLFNEMCNRAGHNSNTKPNLIDCIFDMAGSKIVVK